MCTKLETKVTTTSMIAVSESSFSAQLTEKFPEEIQLMIGTISLVLLLVTFMRVIIAQIADVTKSAEEKISANLSAKDFFAKIRERKPENKKPKSGKKTVSLRSILIQKNLKEFMRGKFRRNLGSVSEKSK